MLQKENKTLAFVVNFSIEIDEEQYAKIIYQQAPISGYYELNLVNTFTLDSNGKPDAEELENFVKNKCLSYIHVETDIGKILDKINYNINLYDVKCREVH